MLFTMFLMLLLVLENRWRLRVDRLSRCHVTLILEEDAGGEIALNQTHGALKYDYR